VDTTDVAALQARILDLEAALRQNDANLIATFHLPEQLANIFGLLMSLPLVTADMLQQRLELVADAKVSIYRLRLHMAEYGVTIHSRRTVGYWLDNETKDRVRDRVAANFAPKQATV
jgi:hypothetical protein